MAARANDWLPVIPESVGRDTGMKEFVVKDSTFCAPLFEGDIVEVWSRRRMPCEGMDWTPKSQYDTVRKVRATIVFADGCWQLDYDNPFNRVMEKKMGQERYSKTVAGSKYLFDYGFHGKDEEWFRTFNSDFFWYDIVKIGNRFDNSELLNVEEK